MTSIGLISEGISEHYIIKHIVERYLGEDDCLINQIQPQIKLQGRQEKQGSFGGWLEVLNHCTEEKFKEVLNYNDYIIVQIDTDTCELAHYDVKRTKEDATLKSEEELYNDICKRILKDIPIENRAQFDGKILFAICFNETECWLLPVYYTDKTKCSTNNCLFKLNQKITTLKLSAIPDKDKNSPAAVNTYKSILKNIRKRKDIKDCSQYNYGFRKFMEQLDGIMPHEGQ
ncbi:hypothetical protein [Bacteroides oleiciplenus]|uniref:Uncharacterized protein n=1 Tax=Bacteroides oleiciplenus YIT 12058 TaxID=742727 RepID=K9DTV8_9BACE|nr:hypothetical protein [Bacteroides oleiciplenus]EKU87848.1 hypothetical protein HMPREF9447_04594 [Bacteroides oleiciplenus YIT 12058]